MRNWMLCTAAGLAILTSPAAAQDDPAERRQQRREAQPSLLTSSWSVEVSAAYTDNFARIQEGTYERFFRQENGRLLTRAVFVPQPDGEVDIVQVPINDTVEIETDSRLFGTATFAGLTAVQRPRLRGIVQGNVTVGAYADGGDIEDVNREALDADLPQFAIDTGAVGTVGNRNFQEFFVNPRMNGLAELDLTETVSLEGGGFVTQQAIRPGNELLAQAPGQNFNQAIIGGVYLGPVYNVRFRDDQNVEARYRTSAIVVLDENIDDLIDAEEVDGFIRNQRVTSDSLANEVQLTYGTGYLFEPVTVEVDVFARHILEEGSDFGPDQEVEQISGSATGFLSVTPRLQGLATFGYDSISSSFTSFPDRAGDRGAFGGRASDGVFYAVGLRYRPNSNSLYEASIGERFGGLQVGLTANTEVTSRLRLDAEIERRFTSGLLVQQDQQRFFGTASLNFLNQLRDNGYELDPTAVERLSRGPLEDFNIYGGQNFAAQAVTQMQAALTGAYGRNTLRLIGNAIIFNGEERVGFGQGDRYTIGFGASRRVTRRLNVNADLTATFNDLGDRQIGVFGPTQSGGVIQQSYRIGTSYTLSRRWALTGSYLHLRRDLEDAPEVASLVRGTLFEFQENQVRVGARLRF